MAIYGADIEALETLATQLEAHKETMVALIHQSTSQIDGLLWEGPDSVALRPEWIERLLRLVTLLDETFGGVAVEASAQAVEQREASEL